MCNRISDNVIKCIGPSFSFNKRFLRRVIVVYVKSIGCLSNFFAATESVIHMLESVSDFRVRAADDPASLLVVIFDTSVQSWLGMCEKDNSSVDDAVIALQGVTEQLLVFLKAFILLHDSNKVCFIVSDSLSARILYPVLKEPNHSISAEDVVKEDIALTPNSKNLSTNFVIDHEQEALELHDGVVNGVKTSIEEQEASGSSFATSRLSAAMSIALCTINRASRTNVKNSHSQNQALEAQNESKDEVNGRILAVLAGKDAPNQYVPMMNCIFSAQRVGVPIDTCNLSLDSDSTYFQQAAHLTNGIYIKPDDFSLSTPNNLLQYLMTVFLVDKQSRDFLAMPTPTEVDFRASCMETKTIIQEGYTCSVCLATLSEAVGKGAPICPICNARFAVRGRRKLAKR